MPKDVMQKPRRTQEERSATTRAALLDATIDCLIDLGYGATTTTVIAERAGVSRGAQLHHYPTKAELVAAAVEHLALKMAVELAAEAQSRIESGGDRLAATVDALWVAYSTPLFEAWLELAVAARTDADLRDALAPVDQRLRHGLAGMSQQLFGGDEVDQKIQMTFFLLQGMALTRALGSGGKRARTDRERATLETWKQLLTTNPSGET